MTHHKKYKPFDVTKDYWECPASNKDKNADRDRLLTHLKAIGPEYVLGTSVDKALGWPMGRAAKIAGDNRRYFYRKPEYTSKDTKENGSMSNFICIHPHLVGV